MHIRYTDQSGLGGTALCTLLFHDWVHAKNTHNPQMEETILSIAQQVES